jgi:hypothetical protein
VRHGHHAGGVNGTHLFDDLKKAIELAEQSVGGLAVKLQARQLRQALDIVG